MTAPHDPTEPTEATELDPEREAVLRRVLAESAGPEPLPAQIAARLDGVLAGLVEERATVPTVSHPEGHGVVVPLDAAARRRRVRVRVLLGAAAAVVAVGVGVGAINTATQQGSDDLSAANEMAEEDPARSDEGGSSADGQSLDDGAAEAPAQEPEGASPEPGEDDEELLSSPEPRRVVTDDPLREVRPERLREDLVALQHVTLPRAALADYSRPTLSAPASFMCEPAAFGPGYLVGIEYAGKPAVVAFREPVGSTQAAEVLACGTGDVLHSTTLTTTG